MTVRALKMDMLDKPPAGNVRVLEADGYRIRVGGKHLISLNVFVLVENLANPRWCVGEAEMAENGDKLAPALWRKTLGESPFRHRPMTVRAPRAEQSLVCFRWILCHLAPNATAA
jgi:hypothetical protein